MPPPAPSTERVLGKYHIVRPLKVGGTAAIYLAIMRGENNFSREVVIKRPLPHLIADPRSRLMFIDEAHIAARLSHPNICQVLDLISRDDEIYLVLEYLRGVDLREILKRCVELNRHMPVEVAVWLAVEVCAGLDFAHEALGLDGRPLNLVHRDVSPKNIRITFSGSVKVLDFGIARAMNRATETAAGTIKGTLGYMSPEQILGDEIDRRSDVFAFGICLFQMLALRNPFDGPTLKERVRRLTHAPIPSVRDWAPSLDEEIEGIVGRCLDRDILGRYQRMRDVQTDLERYLSRLQVVSPRQRLIQFLQEIFPNPNEADQALQMALSELSSVTGRIDTDQRLRFPDDRDTLHDAPGARSPSRATRPTDTLREDSTPTITPDAFGPERPTQSGGPAEGSEETRPLPTRAIRRQVAAPEPLPSGEGRRWGLLGALLAAVAVGAAAAVVLWPRDVEVTALEPPLPAVVAAAPVDTPAAPPDAVDPPAAPGPDAAPRPAGPANEPRDPGDPGAPGDRSRPQARPPREGGVEAVDRQRSRLFFRAALRRARDGYTDDARLLYILAHAQGGSRPDATIYYNLGLLHDREGNVAKAKACLRGYLERTSSPPEVAVVQAKLASYGAVESVPCVSKAEIDAAKQQYARRGPVIDAWLDEKS